jgi:hypothetical protein
MVGREGFWAIWICCTLGAACGDDDVVTPVDAGRLDAGSGGRCASDTDCADALFCNGEERCLPADPMADAEGCVAGPAPCAIGEACDEPGDTCMASCPVPRDADADGAIAMACGGNDCDDADPIRFPGATEVCDVDAHDEDCDPSTFGFRDSDMDAFPDDACCNIGPDSVPVCGNDCDDAQPGVHPTEAETCDGLDNDCDESVDETVRSTCWADADEDGYAPAGAAAMETCGACPIGTTMREPIDADVDCDDALDTVYPTAIERCDGLDSDCSDGGGADMAEDQDGDMHTDPAYAGCTDGFPKDDCADHDPDVFPGQTAWFGTAWCPLGYVEGSCPAGQCRRGFPLGSPCEAVGSFDYDCDTVAERQPTVSGCAGACAMMACPRVEGPSYAGTPACGSSVTYRRCGCRTGFTCGFSDLPAAPLGCH